MKLTIISQEINNNQSLEGFLHEGDEPVGVLLRRHAADGVAVVLDALENVLQLLFGAKMSKEIGTCTR